MTQQIILGSLGAIGKRNGKSLAVNFMAVEIMVMIDISASMTDEIGGKSKYSLACEQLELLQNNNPGKVGVCCFSERAFFCANGLPLSPRMNTDMVAALEMLKTSDNSGIKLILISDGEPDDKPATLSVASKFISPITTIFIGEEGDSGREFLRKLSAATGGISITNEAKQLHQLSENIQRLIGA